MTARARWLGTWAVPAVVAVLAVVAGAGPPTAAFPAPIRMSTDVRTIDAPGISAGPAEMFVAVVLLGVAAATVLWQVAARRSRR